MSIGSHNGALKGHKVTHSTVLFQILCMFVCGGTHAIVRITGQLLGVISLGSRDQTQVHWSWW